MRDFIFFFEKSIYDSQKGLYYRKIMKKTSEIIFLIKRQQFLHLQHSFCVYSTCCIPAIQLKAAVITEILQISKHFNKYEYK